MRSARYESSYCPKNQEAGGLVSDDNYNGVQMAHKALTSQDHTAARTGQQERK